MAARKNSTKTDTETANAIQNARKAIENARSSKRKAKAPAIQEIGDIKAAISVTTKPVTKVERVGRISVTIAEEEMLFDMRSAISDRIYSLEEFKGVAVDAFCDEESENLKDLTIKPGPRVMYGGREMSSYVVSFEAVLPEKSDY